MKSRVIQRVMRLHYSNLPSGWDMEVKEHETYDDAFKRIHPTWYRLRRKVMRFKRRHPKYLHPMWCFRLKWWIKEKIK